MKNILIIISGLKIGGGAEKSAIMMGNGLIKKGHTVRYLTFYDAVEKYDFEGEEICLDEKKSKNILFNIAKLFKRASSIKRYCKQYSIDTTISFMEEANFPNILSKILGNKARVVISVRNNLETSNSYLYKKIIRILYPKADFIVPIVKEEVKNLVDNYGISPKKVRNIYNMFDLQDISKKSQEELGKYKPLFNNGKFTYINIGRFFKQKNQRLLLDAFDKMYTVNKNIQLVILGDGELKEELQVQRQSLSSKADIHFLGVQKNPYKFMQHSNAFIFTSSWEGMGRVIVEAMTCGLPVISTDCKVGPKEILKKNLENFNTVNEASKEKFGILVPVADRNSLVEAMGEIYQDQDLQDYYSKKSEIRAKDFSIEKIINEWEYIL